MTKQKNKQQLVQVKLYGKEYWLPKNWQDFEAKQLITVRASEITEKTNAAGLAKSKVASRYCLGCNKPTCSCTNNAEISKFIAAHPEQFRFFKKNPGTTPTRVLVVEDGAQQEQIDALFKIVKDAEKCLNGAVSYRGNTL